MAFLKILGNLFQAKPKDVLDYRIVSAGKVLGLSSIDLALPRTNQGYSGSIQ
jgi:hypothetical protein